MYNIPKILCIFYFNYKIWYKFNEVMLKVKPFEADKLQIEYNLDKELISLISEANLKYGEYKSN